MKIQKSKKSARETPQNIEWWSMKYTSWSTRWGTKKQCSKKARGKGVNTYEKTPTQRNARRQEGKKAGRTTTIGTVSNPRQAQYLGSLKVLSCAPCPLSPPAEDEPAKLFTTFFFFPFGAFFGTVCSVRIWGRGTTGFLLRMDFLWPAEPDSSSSLTASVDSLAFFLGWPGGVVSRWGVSQ